MKKPTLSLFLCLTLLFCTFTLGFFFGRNSGRSTITVTALQKEPYHSTLPTLPETTGPLQPEVTFPVDINTAGLQELTALPGIGETLAQRILSHRAACGSFSRPEELLNVEGIGPGKLEAILDYITAGG